MRFVSAFVIALSFMLTPCHARDFQFVNANDLTGYYVDSDSVETESRSTIFATIAIVKADVNRMLVYDVRFNHRDHTYQIVASETIEYDTKNVLESSDNPRAPRAYAPNSEMAELINFIMYGGDLP